MTTDPNDPVHTCKLDGGLTKREYFAALALQGLLAMPETPEDQKQEPGQCAEVYAAAAVLYAEELIAALNKP